MRTTSISFFTAGIVLALATAAHAVGPFIENFAAGTANWKKNNVNNDVSFVASGGPDGSSYVAADFAFANATNPQVAIFRGHDSANASGDAFVGNWLTANIGRLTAQVRHNAPQPLDFFVRLATSANSPAVSFTLPQPVQPNVWTALDFGISFSNPLHTNEGPPTLAFYNGVLSAVGNVQIGVIVPLALATDATNYVYDLDQVRIVPEPASVMLVLAAAASSLMWRRKRSR